MKLNFNVELNLIDNSNSEILNLYTRDGFHKINPKQFIAMTSSNLIAITSILNIGTYDLSSLK